MTPSIYVAGPYSAPIPKAIELNVMKACSMAAALLTQGWLVFCPHAHSHNIADFLSPDMRCNHEVWMRQDLYWLAKCDAIFLLPGWQQSKGALLEYEFAAKRVIPIVDCLAESEALIRKLESTPDRGGA